MKSPLPATAILIMVLLFSSGCMTTAPAYTTGPASGGPTPVVVDALVTLSGSYAPQGAIAEAALLTAEDDINEYAKAIGSQRRINVVFHDTRSDPATALSLAREVQKNGRSVILGHMTSAEIAAIKPFTDSNGMLVLDAGSTSPSLSIAGDSVYRLISDDSAQGLATALLLRERQVNAIVPLWRGDIWGDGLLNATRSAFIGRGGVVLEGVRFDPDTADFSGAVATLDIAAGDAIRTYGADNVGIYLIGFEESAPILVQASEKENLTRVRWFGCDGNAGIPSLAGAAPAARLAAQVNLTSVVWGIGNNEQLSRAQDNIRDRLGYQPSWGPVALYDALWIVHDLLGEVPAGADRDVLKLALVRHLNTYCGETGGLRVNHAGDRAHASYDVLQVVGSPEGSEWKMIAHVRTRDDGSYSIEQMN